MISIHAPHAGSDIINIRVACVDTRFQSTLPMRGATWHQPSEALRPGYFNPRSPCGERPGSCSGSLKPCEFQSTLPMRGATAGQADIVRTNEISIHAPHAGSDAPRYGWRLHSSYFNPRSPCGERHQRRHHGRHGWDFNPRSPCGERRNPFNDFKPISLISIHAPHAGSDFQ